MKEVLEKLNTYHQAIKQFKSYYSIISERVLQEYADKNAKYKIDDFLQSKLGGFYTKVEKITAKHFKKEYIIVIFYHGRLYEKVSNQIVKTLYIDSFKIQEDQAKLIPVDSNNILI